MTTPSEPKPVLISQAFYRQRARRVSFRSEPPPPPREPTRRPAKVAQLLALAHHLERGLRTGAIADQASIARALGFSRARITQLLDLTLLAPDIQEAVLRMEAVDGVEPMAERELRAFAHAEFWADQRSAQTTQQIILNRNHETTITTKIETITTKSNPTSPHSLSNVSPKLLCEPTLDPGGHQLIDVHLSDPLDARDACGLQDANRSDAEHRFLAQSK